MIYFDLTIGIDSTTQITRTSNPRPVRKGRLTFQVETFDKNKHVHFKDKTGNIHSPRHRLSNLV
jgi:hypothetical protein